VRAECRCTWRSFRPAADRPACASRLRNFDLRSRGRVETRYGDGLAQSVISETGDFLFIPAGVPHEAINLSTSEPARAIVARNDPAEQDNVVPYTP